MIIRYEQSFYKARIAELEGYYSQLSGHLDRLEQLREEMYQFWEDQNAQEAGQVLQQTILKVKNHMDRVQTNLILNKSIVEQMEGLKAENSGELGAAMSLLGKL